MQLATKTKCPYCGHEQNFITEGPHGQTLVLCDPEDGGCDEWYAVFWQARLSARTYAIGKEPTQ